MCDLLSVVWLFVQEWQAEPEQQWQFYLIGFDVGFKYLIYFGRVVKVVHANYLNKAFIKGKTLFYM